MSVSRVRENRMHGSMRRREATTASRASTRRAAMEASRRPYILDVFSRYAVGWTVQYRENAQLATALIEQATEQQQITPKMLTLHADRGSPQRAKPVAFLLADLGVGSQCTSRVSR
jgi:transposase InsO family protein